MSGYDAIIIGGPAGDLRPCCWRARFRVVVPEDKFRGFIGESILPLNFPLVQELGLEESLARCRIEEIRHEFGMG